MKLAWLLCMLLAACSTGPRRVPELALPPQRLGVVGASILPLEEPGWLLAEKKPYELALAKHGPTPDETRAIQVFVVKLPEFTSQEEFVQRVTPAEMTDVDPSRYKVISHSVEADSQRGEVCSLSHAVVEDHKAQKRTDTPGHVILETLVLTCSHPGNRRVGISVVYSQRTYPENRDQTFLERAQQVLSSVEFTALK